MTSIIDMLKPTKVIEELSSPVNGKIEVIKSVAFGTYIQVGGLTQSGGVVSDVWRTSLKKVFQSKKVVNKCLILGFGAGSNALLVNKMWPDAQIRGVDMDPKMISLGSKYLKVDESVAETVIDDAYEFTKKEVKKKNKYDLLLVDLYLGHEYPKQFESEDFVKLTKGILSKDGIVVFNRLYYGNKRKLAIKFSKLLEEIYGNITIVYPEANVMYVCRNN